MAKKKKDVEEPIAEVLDDVVLAANDVSDETQPSDEPREETPEPDSPGWTEFLLGKLHQDEIHEGFPKAEGLRRLAYEYLGDIITSNSNTIQAPSQANNFHAVVEHHLRIRCHDGEIREWREVADTFPGNCEPAFARFIATCSTRARGRAYRMALRLRACTWEETTTVPVVESGMDGYITPQQLTIINAICGRCNIDVMKFMGHYKKTEGIRESWGGVENIPHSAARHMISRLSEMQRVVGSVPEGILGYNQNWNQNNGSQQKAA